VCPITAKTPLCEAERDRCVAINRRPAAIPRAKSKKISATIQNDAFFSSLLGNTANASSSLKEYKITADYLWDKTYGFSAQYFNTSGTSDALVYSSSQTGSPNSNGYVFQVNYLPFNKGIGPAFWSRSNVKFSLQYVIYNRFDGSRQNIDGAGRSAKDNNTLYLEAWIVF